MFARSFYNLILPAALGAAHVASWFLPKLRDAVAGRRGFAERWRDLADQIEERPVWFHVSSVGEFEQARPIISLIEERHPDIPVIITFSSPSGFEFATRRESRGSGAICFIDYLPLDTAGNMRFCLDAARPRLLVLVKFDLWPNLIWETKDRGVPMLLVAATLSSSSRRLGAARRFYRSVYRCLDGILAISESDAARFRASVPDHPAILITGDTRFDRVMQRWENRGSTRLDIAPNDGRVIIAGSTWPRDAEHLLGALGSLLEGDPALRVIVAPHEPTPGHIDPIERWAGACGFSARRLTTGPVESSVRVVIVDTVGVLAEAYRLGDIAYVGGGFTTGVHSVIEPAIAGLPVLFGPAYHNSFEAIQLIERGAGFCVRNEKEMRGRLQLLLGDESALGQAGRAAEEYVRSQLGASEKCMAALERFL